MVKYQARIMHTAAIDPKKLLFRLIVVKHRNAIAGKYTIDVESRIGKILGCLVSMGFYSI